MSKPALANQTKNHPLALFWHLLAGAFASLSLPPLFLLPAIFALSIPLLAYLKAEGRMQASMIFGAAGTGWFLASTYWVSHSLIVETPSLWGLAPFMALALSLILALFWASAAMVSWSFGWRPVARLFWFVAFFSLGEFARGFVATGFPWNLTGSLFAVDLASLQAASVIGAYGLCVIALLFALVPAFWVLGHRRFAAIFLILPLVLAVFGTVRLANSSDGYSVPSRSMVRLVQPAIPQADKWDQSKRQLHLDRLVGLSRQGDAVSKLVIWPETAFAGFASRSQSLLNTTIRNATQNDGVVITGIPRFGGGRTLLNSAVMINHDGAIKAVYDKRHLVPFGEYMPFRKWLPLPKSIVGPIDFVPGKNNRLMHLEGYGSMQMLICYEVIFAGAVIDQEMRPDMMINITNDAWFGQSAGPWQHLVQAQMRAIEEGLPLMRVANTGISAGFDSYGRILGQIGLNTQGVLDLPLPLALPPTLFARFGNLGFFTLIFLIIGIAAWLDLFRSIRH
ncbi:apolipoprotein N-acyltransferase [Alphaproteobacteria bacterium]|nr:apolipoprotein N-acyltransferase [Alphaproteobacteria bacterium]